MLSIIIPSHKDKYLQKTIDDIRKNARGEIEIIAVLDGYDEKIKGATILQNANKRGLRDCVNSGIAISHGDYILKCDAHCMFDEGFDVKLLADIEDDWVVIPRRYKLDTDKWIICEDDKEPIDYEKLVIDRPDRIAGIHWTSRKNERKDILIDENMVFQGSCWVMSRKHWDRLGGLSEEGYGTFTQEPIEIALKTWLGGGKVMVNKKTWYAHQHRKFGRTHRLDSDEVKAGNTYSRDYWLNNRWEKRIHDISWLVERFSNGLKAIIIPGNGGDDPKNKWYPYLEKELPKLGISVVNKKYPDAVLARKEFWLPFIKEQGADEHTILIGHSSGAVAAMRYAEDNKIYGSILVGACHTDLGLDTERQSGYYDEPWNWKKIKNNQKWIIQFASTDDPYIPIEEARKISKELSTDYHEYTDKGHFSGGKGKMDFPEVIEAIKKMLSQK